MNNSLNAFSDFVSKINTHVRSEDAEGLARWAVDGLSDTLGFDAAWYGWADISPEGVEIQPNATLNLPDAFYETWLTMTDDDLLTNREREVAHTLAAGKNHNGVASATIRNQTQSVYSKLGVDNRASLALVLQKHLIG